MNHGSHVPISWLMFVLKFLTSFHRANIKTITGGGIDTQNKKLAVNGNVVNHIQNVYYATCGVYDRRKYNVKCSIRRIFTLLTTYCSFYVASIFFTFLGFFLYILKTNKFVGFFIFVCLWNRSICIRSISNCLLPLLLPVLLLLLLL